MEKMVKELSRDWIWQLAFSSSGSRSLKDAPCVNVLPFEGHIYSHLLILRRSSASWNKYPLFTKQNDTAKVEFFPQAPHSWAGVSCISLQDKGSQKKVGALSEAGGSGKGEVKEMDIVCGGSLPRDRMIRKKTTGPNRTVLHREWTPLTVSLRCSSFSTLFLWSVSHFPKEQLTVHTHQHMKIQLIQPADIHCSLQPKAPLWDHGAAHFWEYGGGHAQ